MRASRLSRLLVALAAVAAVGLGVFAFTPSHGSAGQSAATSVQPDDLSWT